jgi:RHS repeat-associated protein
MKPTSLFSRIIAIACSFLMVNLCYPMGLPKLVADNWPELIHKAPIVRALVPETRPLTGVEMKKVQGKWAKNPYVAGANKWSVSYKGVDLITENFSFSETDMSFEGGYGIPVNVTRSYSANLPDEGPYGIGWTMSADVRSTAGGVLKSSGAPIRSVPTGFKERNSSQLDDPAGMAQNGDSDQPAEAVLATDASGKEETEQRDVDGIITTPPWDKNTNNAVYEEVTLSGNTYKVLLSNDVTTPDGTVYHYEKKGNYGTLSGSTWTDGGQLDINGTGTSEPSNVLKVTTVTDRQGNVTEYVYKTGTGTTNQAVFNKANGQTLEQKLDHVHMPNGHVINFTWGQNNSGDNYTPTNRLYQINDYVSGDASHARYVTYGYDGSARLTSVKTPADLTTSYDYGTGTAANGSSYSNAGSSDELTSITDPRGLTTTIAYTVEDSTIAPYLVTMKAVRAYKVVHPNGVTTWFYNDTSPVPAGTYWDGSTLIADAAYADVAYGDTDAFQIALMGWGAYTAGYFEVGMGGIGGSDSPAINNRETWRKQYDTQTQDLLWEAHYDRPINNTLASTRKLLSTNDGTKVEVAKTYNFMGNPLSVTTTEASNALAGGSYTNSRVQTIDYAYWGEDKYFQQKATRIQTGSSTYRYTLTDFYDSSASAGAKGQTKEVFSPAFTTFDVTGSGAPSGTSSGDLWKYYIHPASGYTTTAAAKFYDGSGPAYDSKGRVTDVWKLQSTLTSPWTYVQTHTVYGSDSSPHWGQASDVYEDYGTGKINRHTQTTGYTNWGQANDVIDAAGHEFYTEYDKDGRIQSVTRTDVSPNVPIATYNYNDGSGSNLAQKYQLHTVTDERSGVIQTFTYCDSGGGRGSPSSISEDRSGTSNDYSTAYTYNGAGDRTSAVYDTPNGTTKWGYADYVAVGDPSGPSRVFQTLRKLDSSTGYPTSEEMEDAYGGSGRLLVTGFAQTPASGFTPSTGNSYYDSTHRAASRARAYYVYDPGGRITQVNHWWDVWNSGTSDYGTPDALLSNTCSYEVSTGTSNYNRGLKTISDFYTQNSSDHTAFALDHEEQYAYDSTRDYLTSASYDGGSTTTTWSYDAAGNRNDATAVDNLNRATTISSVSRTYDILGNTTAIGSTKTMSWDELNRMTGFTVSSATTSYAYRADGMRISKSNSSVADDWYYDGQMQMEEKEVASSTTVTRYGLGARGIDYIGKTVSSTTTVGFPIYDSHGNMVATIGRSGSNSYTVGNQRGFDVWGGIRSGTSTGDPKTSYCANLGHVQDDESGLQYMRARYYDPSSGRFASEDSAGDGDNWYSYCNNCPHDVDQSGQRRAGLPSLSSFLAYILSQAATYLIEKLWKPKTTTGIIEKQLILATIQAVGAIQMYMSALRADEKYGTAGTALIQAACGILAIAPVLSLMYQLTLLAEIKWFDEDENAIKADSENDFLGWAKDRMDDWYTGGQH